MAIRSILPQFIRSDTPFGNPLDSPTFGPMAIGGDLTPARLLDAYSNGIFPWFDNDAQPVMWWSPDPRCVLYPSSFHMSRSLGKWCKKHELIATTDTDFDRVIALCAQPRAYAESTWITPSMKLAYMELHDEGYAHSLEVRVERELIGGIYGLSLGKHFYGESMFSSKTNGSKVALMALCQLLVKWKFELVDCQLPTAHLISQGAKTIGRSEFISLIRENRSVATTKGPWKVDPFRVLPSSNSF